jgi:hypothetical protein
VGEFERTDRAVLTEGRPTIALETYVRLMLLKQRYRSGYRTLVAGVSDSIHLRRFCRISLTDRVPDESTVRKLTRRIEDRIVSLRDPDARPICKGKLGKPNEFGYVSQLAEVTENTKTGARGLIPPASTELGNPAEETLLPGTIAELERLGIRPREIAVDGAFKPAPTNSAFAGLQPKHVFIAGRQQPTSSEHSGGCGATGPGRRAGSVTSSAATAWIDPA